MPPVVPDLTGPPTPELEEELDRQAAQLLARVLEGRERVERFRALAVAAERQLEGDEVMLRHIHALLGRSDQLCLDTLDLHLRGARVREVALQILEQRDAENEGVHYRDWYEWLRDAGYTVSGRDPLATFLAQISRSADVERVGGARSGRYRVKR
ncbi:MAG TPA: hypothetical protein VGV67_08710 [Solirubrobacteraceae bacterium]|nr:hypothetical protein [Solirubrobacteraceae bacterium]